MLSWFSVGWCKLILIAILIGVAVDGIGSILIKGGQKHNIWFDGERYLRTIMGIVGAVIVFLFVA